LGFLFAFGRGMNGSVCPRAWKKFDCADGGFRPQSRNRETDMIDFKTILAAGVVTLAFGAGAALAQD